MAETAVAPFAFNREPIPGSLDNHLTESISLYNPADAVHPHNLIAP